MEKNQNVRSRKKFLLWSAAALSSVTVLRFARRVRMKKPETVKMLSQDGRLVEINKELIAPIEKKKITDAELQHWIKTKKNNV